MRYRRPTAEQAAENQRLAEAVLAELAITGPGGIRYATFRLADGAFVLVADIEDGPNPLLTNTALAAFQQGLSERCEEGEGPNPQDATLAGEGRFFDR